MKTFNNSYLQDIDLKSAKINYDDFDIDPEIPLDKQELSLQQDIIQLTAKGIYTIDVGWYPMLNPYGFFRIVVIKDYDWDNPIFDKKTNDLKTMKTYLQEAIDFVESLKKVK